jgi:hypothetical protein
MAFNFNFTKWDFAILKENWSRYRLDDGSQMKVRVAVTDIHRTIQTSNTGYPELQYFSQNIVSVIIPEKLRGTPSIQAVDIQNEVPEELRFEEIEVLDQEYITPDGFKIIVKPVLQKVFKYNKYNSLGEPVYQVSMQSIANIEKIRNTQES